MTGMKGEGKGAAAGGSAVPGGSSDGKSAAAANAQKPLPKDAQVMVAILKDMGITDYEPRVINQMLEFSYRYVTNVLDEAKAVSNHARKKTVDVDDVKLAVQMYADQNLTSPPTRDILLETARTKNAVPLPIPRATSGMRLPPERHCLTACNYRLRNKPKRGPPGFGASYKGGGASGATLPPKMMALPQQQTPFMMNANPGPIPDIPQIKIDPMRAGGAVGAMPKIQISAGPVGGTGPSGTQTANQQPLFKISVNPQSL